MGYDESCATFDVCSIYPTIATFLIFVFRFSTPLHLAVLVHNDDILTLLLDEHTRSSKIDLNAQTVDDHTPLYYALINTLKLDTDDSFANRLVTAGANPNPVSSCHRYIFDKEIKHIHLFPSLII